MITKKELDILNSMPICEFEEAHKENGLSIEINNGKVSGYAQEFSDYDEEREM